MNRKAELSIRHKVDFAKGLMKQPVYCDQLRETESVVATHLERRGFAQRNENGSLGITTQGVQWIKEMEGVLLGKTQVEGELLNPPVNEFPVKR